MSKILVIDDEVQIRSLLARMLGLEGYEVCQAGDCKAALKQLETQSPDVALCDVFLPDGNGVDLVLNIKKLAPNVEVILLTAHGNIPDGVQAIKNGAFDYITKGDDNNKIIPLISRAVEKAKMNVRLEKLEKKVGQMYSFDSILGESKALKEAVLLAQKVSVTDVPVLLTGETGTGKEVFAQAIHYSSKRSKQNFVAVNCSSFSKELLESEMFGHRAGSFTGALKDKKGLFEEANNGTIFLDEIGEMAFELQAKLLRILETGEYIKIGDKVKTQFTKQIATSASDIKKLTDGMDALKTGSSALSTGIGTLYAGIKQLSTGADSLDSGMSQLKTGSTSLAEGTGKLKTGASDLNDGMKTLSEGAGTLSKKIGDASPKIKAGIGTIDTAASQISDGAKTLASGTTELKDGIVTLADGTKELKDGTIKLNDEGISKITKTFKEDAPDAIDKIQETLNNGKKYNSFSGIDKNMSGNVKFILKAQEISNDK